LRTKIEGKNLTECDSLILIICMGRMRARTREDYDKFRTFMYVLFIIYLFKFVNVNIISKYVILLLFPFHFTFHLACEALLNSKSQGKIRKRKDLQIRQDMHDKSTRK